jgi:hypothetical protein
MLQRLPLSVEKLTDPRMKKPFPLEKQAALEICLRSSTLVFDLLITHSRSLRALEPFQSLWLRTITHLAVSVQSVASGIYQSEFVEMIGSLFRLLSPPPSRAQNDSQTQDLQRDHPKQAPLSDLTLLQISWHAARAGCPNLLSLLKKTHPMIAELLQESRTKQSSAEPKPSASISVPLGSESQRSLYSRLFESKSQIV